MGSETKQKNTTWRDKLLTVIGAVLCVILIPILVANCTLIIRSYIDPDNVPSLGGVMPLVVLTDSMYPEIESGDLIFCRKADTAALSVGDIIVFRDPEGKGDVTIIVHRIVNITEEGGKRSFTTRGDANNVDDPRQVAEEDVVGLYKTRIAGAGDAAMFMQTTQGFILCVATPILLLVGYDVLRSRARDKHNRNETEALMAELEALRAAQNAKNGEE